jgi:hypothetical protein
VRAAPLLNFACCPVKESPPWRAGRRVRVAARRRGPPPAGAASPHEAAFGRFTPHSRRTLRRSLGLSTGPPPRRGAAPQPTAKSAPWRRRPPNSGAGGGGAASTRASGSGLLRRQPGDGIAGGRGRSRGVDPRGRGRGAARAGTGAPGFVALRVAPAAAAAAQAQQWRCGGLGRVGLEAAGALASESASPRRALLPGAAQLRGGRARLACLASQGSCSDDPAHEANRREKVSCTGWMAQLHFKPAASPSSLTASRSTAPRLQPRRRVSAAAASRPAAALAAPAPAGDSCIRAVGLRSTWLEALRMELSRAGAGGEGERCGRPLPSLHPAPHERPGDGGGEGTAPCRAFSAGTALSAAREGVAPCSSRPACCPPAAVAPRGAGGGAGGGALSRPPGGRGVRRPRHQRVRGGAVGGAPGGGCAAPRRTPAAGGGGCGARRRRGGLTAAGGGAVRAAVGGGGGGVPVQV